MDTECPVLSWANRAVVDFTDLVQKHEAGEQQVVHPVTRNAEPDGSQLVGVLVDEEVRADRTIAKLREIGVGHPTVDDLRDLAHAGIEVPGQAKPHHDVPVGHHRAEAPVRALDGQRTDIRVPHRLRRLGDRRVAADVDRPRMAVAVATNAGYGAIHSPAGPTAAASTALLGSSTGPAAVLTVT